MKLDKSIKNAVVLSIDVYIDSYGEVRLNSHLKHKVDKKVANEIINSYVNYMNSKNGGNA